MRFLAPFLALALAACAPGRKPVAQASHRPYPLLGDFDLYVAPSPRLFIWDTHPVESPALVRYVCETMQTLGFRPATSGRANLLVNIQVLAKDRNPKVRILVVEGLEPIQLRRVWIGQTTINGEAEDPDLDAFLASLEMDSRVAALERGPGTGKAPGAQARDLP